jgi:hypothetical protein
VEGCLGVASIKSNLDQNQLYDALGGIASIPPTEPIGNRLNPLLKIDDYDNWPYKIIYSSNGISAETILTHLNSYYSTNLHIPLGRRPDIIHVIGKYVIFKGKKGANRINTLNGDKEQVNLGEYYLFTISPDVQAFSWIFNELQSNALMSSHILYDYSHIINKINL